MAFWPSGVGDSGTTDAVTQPQPYEEDKRLLYYTHMVHGTTINCPQCTRCATKINNNSKRATVVTSGAFHSHLIWMEDMNSIFYIIAENKMSFIGNSPQRCNPH